GYAMTWNDYDAFVRIFNADGSARSGQITVHDLKLGGQYDTDIAGLSDGNFVVTWATNTGAANGTISSIFVSARIYTADGHPLTDEFQVNQQIENTQGSTSITVLANGNFVVSWQSQDPDVDGDGYAISARIYSPAGVAQGDEFALSPINIDSYQITPEIAALTNGGFVVLYGSATGLMARVFDPEGILIVEEFKVDSRNSYFNSPNVVGLEDGGFAVTWIAQEGSSGNPVYHAVTRVFDLGSGVRAYTEGEDAVLLAPNLTTSDVDSATLSGATVSISGGFVAGEDVLSWASSALPGGVAAVYDPTTGVLTFTGVASLAQYQALLDTVGYSNSSITPDQGQRSVSFQITDDHGATSNEIIKLVNVHEIADPVAADLVDVVSETPLLDGAGNVVFTSGASGEAEVEHGVIVSSSYDGSLGAATQSGLNWTANDGSWSFSLDRLGAYSFTILKPELISDAQTTGAFGYTVDSLHGPAESATITITINDDGPTAYADSNAVVEGVTTSLTAQYGVLANDVLGDGGATITALAIGNGTPLAIHVGQAIETTLGYLTLNADGSYSYTAKPGVAVDSQDSFTYQITSANGDTSTATLTLFVTDADTPNTAPVLGTLGDGIVVPTSLEFAVSDLAGNHELANGTSITKLSDGRLVSVWTVNDNAYGRFYSPEGEALDVPFVLDHKLSNFLRSASVTALEDGGFVATWLNLGVFKGITARAFNADGSPRGDEFDVNLTIASEVYAPVTTALADGGYAMTWNDYDAFVRIFNADGSARSGQITVHD
ncbi:Ig-like domain-containing protein, partial [Kiloniella laminariae]